VFGPLAVLEGNLDTNIPAVVDEFLHLTNSITPVEREQLRNLRGLQAHTIPPDAWLRRRRLNQRLHSWYCRIPYTDPGVTYPPPDPAIAIAAKLAAEKELAHADALVMNRQHDEFHAVLDRLLLRAKNDEELDAAQAWAARVLLGNGAGIVDAYHPLTADELRGAKLDGHLSDWQLGLMLSFRTTPDAASPKQRPFIDNGYVRINAALTPRVAVQRVNPFA
jgi:hypothetical protein